jgi:hypothetical protein
MLHSKTRRTAASKSLCLANHNCLHTSFSPEVTSESLLQVLLTYLERESLKYSQDHSELPFGLVWAMGPQSVYPCSYAQASASTEQKYCDKQTIGLSSDYIIIIFIFACIPSGPWPPCTILHFPSVAVSKMGRDSSFGITTCYRLEGPGIEYQSKRDFPHTYSNSKVYCTLHCTFTV